MKQIIGYKCDYCGKLYQRKHSAEMHEKCCEKNPDNNRPCFRCSHLDKVKYDFYYDTYCGEDMRAINILKCEKKGIYLYPPKVEYKGNAFPIDDINEPMPRECADVKILSISEVVNGII